jgi:hypothetical protein
MHFNPAIAEQVRSPMFSETITGIHPFSVVRTNFNADLYATKDGLPMAFTARWLDALKAKGNKPEEHFEPDPDYRGLAIRVAPSGRKTWTFHYTFETRRRRLDFGHYQRGAPPGARLPQSA